MNLPPKWVLSISYLFALMEIAVSLYLLISPESMADQLDLSARGVNYLMYVWASRQFALGSILAYSSFKKSIPMLQICFLFLLLMFLGDALIGYKLGDFGTMAVGLVFAGAVGGVMWKMI